MRNRKNFTQENRKIILNKNQLIVLPHGADIVDLSVGKRGPESDINLWREQQDIFASEQKFSGDKAYVSPFAHFFFSSRKIEKLF